MIRKIERMCFKRGWKGDHGVIHVEGYRTKAEAETALDTAVNNALARLGDVELQMYRGFALAVWWAGTGYAYAIQRGYGSQPSYCYLSTQDHCEALQIGRAALAQATWDVEVTDLDHASHCGLAGDKLREFITWAGYVREGA